MRLGGPRGAVVLLAVVTVGVLLVGRVSLGPSPSFLPAVLAVVAVFDLLAVLLLRAQFRDEGDPRTLALSWAYTWSLVVMVGYALAFPGVVGQGPLNTWSSSAPYLWVSWHAGFPLLIGLAFAPWPAGWDGTVDHPLRSRVFARSSAIALLAGGFVVAAVATSGSWAPSVIAGLDTTRMSMLCGPGMAVCCLLGTWWTWRGVRGRTGPERWAPLAASAVCADVLLTLASLHRFSLGWYTGRLLTVVSAGVVVLAMLTDVQRTRFLLARESALLAGLLTHTDNPIVVKDLDGGYLLGNAALAELLGVAPDSLAGLTASRTTDGTTARAISDAEAEVIAHGRPVRHEEHHVAPDGTERTYLTTRFLLRDQEGEPFALGGIGHDITPLVDARRELHRQATTDSLTGLLNRGALVTELDQRLRSGRAAGGALVLFDVDHFKAINDTHGHAVGDAVIVEAGRRLAAVAAAAPGSLAVRLGGDELVLVLAPGRSDELLARSRDAVAELALPYDTGDGLRLLTSASAGLTWLRACHDRTGQPLKEADLALYRAKDGGRGRLVVFADVPRAPAQRRPQVSTRA